ncbi:MAG: rhodanese-like domain-containing protein [Bacteroidales bacterium]|nr:rhodanese-like domain-containing protein [Bacteroidales bacterium]
MRISKISPLNHKLFWISIALLHLLVASCTSADVKVAAEHTADGSEMLINYLETGGDYINSKQAPAIMTAPELHAMLDRNILIIDLREHDQYASGHIEGAVNVAPGDLVGYFRKIIDASAFERIVFTCSRGQLSAYVTGMMRQLGYDNTFSVRYGLNAWSLDAARSGWDLVVGNGLADRLESTSYAKNPSTSLPKVITSKKTGYDIASERADSLLKLPTTAFLLSIEDLMAGKQEYYLVNYWTEEQYNQHGHLPGAVQYTPKQSLGRQTALLSLPTDKPVLVYCNNGHHSAHVAAYLRLIGYQAYSLIYGANSFMIDVLRKKETNPHASWGESQKNDYPLVSSEQIKSSTNTPSVEIKSAAGGC